MTKIISDEAIIRRNIWIEKIDKSTTLQNVILKAEILE